MPKTRQQQKQSQKQGSNIVREPPRKSARIFQAADPVSFDIGIDSWQGNYQKLPDNHGK